METDASEHDDRPKMHPSRKTKLKSYLLILFTLSVLLTIFLCLFVRESTYFTNTVLVHGGWDFWGMFEVFMGMVEGVGGITIIVIALCCMAHFFVADFFLTKSAIIKSRELGSGGIRLMARVLWAQFVSLGIMVLSLPLILLVSMIALGWYGFVDIKTHLDMDGVVTDDAAIVEHIKKSDKVVRIYDARGKEGVVLAKRDLKGKGPLTAYEAAVLPVLVRIMPADDVPTTYFVPETNSLVYTSFILDRTEPMIIELAYSYMRNSDKKEVADAFSEVGPPTVDYVHDDEYKKFVKEKRSEQIAEYISTLSEYIEYNEEIMAQCSSDAIYNKGLIRETEEMYQKGCVEDDLYSDCAEIKDSIEYNKNLLAENAEICRENQLVLDEQYETLEAVDQEVQEYDDTIGNNISELSAGMYFPDAKKVVMRVSEDFNSFSYMEVLLHEMLHHYSHGGPYLEQFLNEGITEYLTYDQLGVEDIDMPEIAGYYKELQIVMALLEKIPEDELLEVYFDGEENSFRTLFRKYFPRVDYQDFLEKGNQVFLSTYEAENNLSEEGTFDTEVDHPHVQDIREFLGLERLKFYSF